MKRNFRYIAAIVLATGICSCTEFEEFNKNDNYVPAPGETVKLILSADKGGSDVGPDTRVYVGEITGGKVRYFWNEEDQIGVIPFLQDANPNYVTKETLIQSDKNLAQFEAYITAEGYNTSAANLLIYYPYNSSMLEGTSGSHGQDYAAAGLTFRLPQIQEQYGYSMSFVGEGDSEISKHPSVWALSHYGLAYDLAASAISTETEGGQTIANATGEFQLDHVNTYFQFNVYGTESDNSDKHYGDGTWRVASIALEAGNCTLSTDSKGETKYTMTDKVAIAGTYKFSYDYDADDFTDVSGTKGNDENIALQTVAGGTSVTVRMNDIENAPRMGDSPESAVPAFAVINALDIAQNPKGTLNCLKVSVTCYHYNADGDIIGSDTRVRYFNIESLVGQDLAGDYYTIDFEVCDPVESYTDLSGSTTANTYIISAPGNYSFDATVAGNGRLPYGTSGSTILGIDPSKLLVNGIENYGLTWLWASGTTFESVDNGSMTDTQVVKQVLNSVGLSGEDGQFSIGLNDVGGKLSGNILLALYEKGDEDEVGEIVWTWHIWLSQPEVQYYKFPATNSEYLFTNEDWYMMDRNLGAETAELGNPRSSGLYYQRSRKEPMIGFGSIEGSTTWTQNQIKTYRNTEVFGTRAVWASGAYEDYGEYGTLSNPMVLMTGIPSQNAASEYYYAWSSSQGADDANDVSNDTKSMFDPCPPGYRMPTVREWDNFKNDIYHTTGGVQGTGVFGYCPWKELPTIITDTEDPRNIDYVSRIDAGDYYTVNEQFERTYYISKNSGTGSPIVTYFPNTGLLRGKGEWSHLNETGYYEPDTETYYPAGPEVSAEISEEAITVQMIKAPEFSQTPSLNDKKDKLNDLYFVESGSYVYTIDPSVNPASGTALKYENNKGSYKLEKFEPKNITENVFTVYIYRVHEIEGQNVYSNATTITLSKEPNPNDNKKIILTIEGYEVGGLKEVTLTSPIVTAALTITISGASGSYSYATSEDGAKNTIDGSTVVINPGDLTYKDSQSTLYFYQTDLNGNISSATTLVVAKTDAGYEIVTITVGEEKTVITPGDFVEGETATSAVWTSGRVDSGTFYTYWYGPGQGPGDGYGENNAPFVERRETYGLSFSPMGIDTYWQINAGNFPITPEWNNDPALPIRCLREYDNTSTSTVSE